MVFLFIYFSSQAQTSTVSVQSMYPGGLNEDSSIRSIQQTYNLAQQQEQQLLQTLLGQQRRLMTEACLDIHSDPVSEAG